MMLEGVLEYRADISGIAFETFDFSCDHQWVTKIEAGVPEEGTVKIKVHLSGGFSLDTIQAEIDKVVREVVDRLAFRFVIFIGDPCFTRGSLKASDGSNRAWGHMTSALTIQIQPVTMSVCILRSDMERANPPGEHYFPLFRCALGNADTVARFLALYHILLLILGDNQQNVDNFIRHEEPVIQQSPRPDRPSISETVYTRLRNEFSHARPGADFVRTRREMEQHVQGLTHLVKKLIEQQP